MKDGIMKTLVRCHLFFAFISFVALIGSLYQARYFASSLFFIVFIGTMSMEIVSQSISEPWDYSCRALQKWLKSHQGDVNTLFCLYISIHAQGVFQSCVDRQEFENTYNWHMRELSDYFGAGNIQRISHEEILVLRTYPSNKFSDENEKTDYQCIVCQTIVQRLEQCYESSMAHNLPPVSITIGCAGSGIRYQMDSLEQLVDLAYYTEQEARKRRLKWLVADIAVRARKLDIDECKKGFFQVGWQEEFNPFFQPIILADSNTVIGVESFARWQLGEFRILSARVFKELACDLQHITTIDITIITKTLAIIRKMILERAISYDFKVVLNISNESLKKDFSDKMVNLVEQIGLNPNQIEFDIKDSALSNPENFVTISALREQGFTVSLDAFNDTAFDLQAFARADFDCIKLDFVAYSTHLRHVYAALIDASTKQNISVSAKGIENRQMLEAAISLGCSYVQGNYFTLPVNEDTFKIFMHKYHNGLDLEPLLG